MRRRLAARPAALLGLAALGILAALGASRHDVSAAAQPPDGFRAPSRLIDTGLYAEGQPGVIDSRNRAFSPQYPLWSDGARKARWIYLPPGAAIDTSDPAAWQFPVGTRFWKEFTFGGRKVETRLIWRASVDRWVFASYHWNDAGTDATLAPVEGVRHAVEVAPGRRHAIPSMADCRACHETTRVEPLGFNALQLSTDRDPNAIHAEPLAPGMVTLQTLDAEQRLVPARPELVARPPRIRAASASTRSVLGYLSANCGGCHNPESGLVTFGRSLRLPEILDGDAVAEALVRHKTTWQVPGTAEGASLLIDPADPDASALVARMRSRRPSSQMPPLGTVLEDREALERVRQWIQADLGRCEPHTSANAARGLGCGVPANALISPPSRPRSR